MRGAATIHHEVQQQRLAVVTQEAITVWHVEAESAANGVGLIKLMGWSAGHIALHTMLISRDVDCCLIPVEDLTS
uniref:Uncharacterized protein n=1 Tax=Oryza glumipatula TaxID=40148 RepID=A0A0E0A6Q9_9ORYZ